MNRENQQETATESEIAWLAGIIEGEGTVALSCWQRKPGVKPKIGTEIKLYNTDSGLINKAIEIVNKLGINPYISQRDMSPMHMVGGEKYGGVDPMLTVTVKKIGDTFKLASLLRPWFFGDKAGRLDLMIQYLGKRLEKISEGGKALPLDIEDIKVVANFYKSHVKRNNANTEMVDRLLRDFTCGAEYTMPFHKNIQPRYSPNSCESMRGEQK